MRDTSVWCVEILEKVALLDVCAINQHSQNIILVTLYKHKVTIIISKHIPISSLELCNFLHLPINIVPSTIHSPKQQPTLCTHKRL
jgi:hypothetical protein